MRVAEGYVIDADLPALTADGRDEARGRSLDCEHCCGEGLVIVDATGPRMRSPSCAATCSCVHGRWIRAWHVVNKGRHLLDRLPALEDVLTGRRSCLRYDPGDDAEPSDVPTRRDINAMFPRISS